MTIAFVLGVFVAFYGALGVILAYAIRKDSKKFKDK
jgi:hypothetical protein